MDCTSQTNDVKVKASALIRREKKGFDYPNPSSHNHSSGHPTISKVTLHLFACRMGWKSTTTLPPTIMVRWKMGKWNVSNIHFLPFRLLNSRGLGGGFNPFQKYKSNWTISPIFRAKIQHLWNHHPGPLVRPSTPFPICQQLWPRDRNRKVVCNPCKVTHKASILDEGGVENGRTREKAMPWQSNKLVLDPSVHYVNRHRINGDEWYGDLRIYHINVGKYDSSPMDPRG